MTKAERQRRYEREKKIYNAHPDKMHESDAKKLVEKIDARR